jgi:putative DNA primase/helicase
MDELRAFLRELGFEIPVEKFILDGSLQRFPRNGSRDSGWFIGWLYNYLKRDGQYAIAEFGDWRTGESHLFVPTSIGSAEKKLAKDTIENAKKKIAAEKAILQRQAADKARKRFDAASTDGTTPYIERKQLNGLYGARIAGDNVVVPMRTIDGEIVGTQRITPDGGKWFEKGGRVDEAFHLIGSLEKDILVCEGFATGCSLHMATRRSVAIAFNAGNLLKVASIIRQHYPDIKMIICGDDDRTKEPNTGREKAQKAASIAMASVVFPECQGTDFNDLHCERGLQAVRDQLKEEPEVQAGFRALGYDDSGHYFYSIEAKDIFRISSFTPASFFMLADHRFWQEKYQPADSNKINWMRATHDLIVASKKKNRFDPACVRGLGVWMDRDRVVVNTGDGLIIDGIPHSLYWPEGEAIYVRTLHKMRCNGDIASVDECSKLLDACELLTWQDPKSRHLLPGWIAVARIASALPIRPHIWLTGGSATGKSTVLNGIICPALGGHEAIMSVQGGTTEAGIRQTLRASSVPLLFDEFESISKSSRDRHDAIVELLRNTWSATTGRIVKGSAGGSSMVFNLTFSALVSSIGVNLLTDADQSRFSVLELAPHGDDIEQFRHLKKCMDEITPEFGRRLFNRIVSLVPTILRNYEILCQEIAKISRQRTGQQVGMLMAGWWALRSDREISREEARAIATDLEVKTINEDRVTEEMECLAYLMTATIRLDEGLMNETATIEQVIFSKSTTSDSHEGVGYESQLRKYGLTVKEGCLFVSENHTWLKHLYANSKWPNWTNFLRRLPGAEKTAARRFGNVRQRATKIPLSIYCS